MQCRLDARTAELYPGSPGASSRGTDVQPADCRRDSVHEAPNGVAKLSQSLSLFPELADFTVTGLPDPLHVIPKVTAPEFEPRRR